MSVAHVQGVSCNIGIWATGITDFLLDAPQRGPVNERGHHQAPLPSTMAEFVNSP
jgi:hypothetical protein